MKINRKRQLSRTFDANQMNIASSREQTGKFVNPNKTFTANNTGKNDCKDLIIFPANLKNGLVTIETE